MAVKIGLDFAVKPEDWDEDKGRIRKSCKDYRSVSLVNNKIEQLRLNAENLIEKLAVTGELNNLSFPELRDRILENRPRQTYRQLSDSIIEELTAANKLGNASCYKQAQTFLDKHSGKKELYFEQIDFRLLKKLETAHLGGGNAYNSLSFYLRTIRSVFNRAIKEKLVSPEYYPFREYSIKQTKTAKRAISKDAINIIKDLILEPETPRWNVRNMFIFSFYNMGMNYVDMAYLKHSNIAQGRIEYTRAKTGKVYTVHITPQTQEILDLYSSPEKKPDDYIFPVLKRTTPELIMQDLQNGRRNFNKLLGKIAKQAGLDVHLTSYVARHSWATIAKDLNIPVSIISQGLGHEDIKTTQIYLDSFDKEVIDNANMKITE
jgi:integrase